MNNLSKTEIIELVKQKFSEKPSKEEIRKLKKLAMSKNIKLGKLKMKFCKKCNSFFNLDNCEIRIKRGFKIIKCKNCGFISRYKL